MDDSRETDDSPAQPTAAESDLIAAERELEAMFASLPPFACGAHGIEAMTDDEFAAASQDPRVQASHAVLTDRERAVNEGRDTSQFERQSARDEATRQDKTKIFEARRARARAATRHKRALLKKEIAEAEARIAYRVKMSFVVESGPINERFFKAISAEKEARARAEGARKEAAEAWSVARDLNSATAAVKQSCVKQVAHRVAVAEQRVRCSAYRCSAPPPPTAATKLPAQALTPNPQKAYRRNRRNDLALALGAPANFDPRVVGHAAILGAA